MKVARLRLANAIKCGTRQADFLTSEHFDMTVENGIVIKCVDRERGDTTYTTLFNTIWWQPEAEQKSEAKEPAKQAGKAPKSERSEVVL